MTRRHDLVDMQCPVCDEPVEPFAPGVVLGRIEVEYVRCGSCGTVHLPRPVWLEEAYSRAISDLDVGLLGRCTRQARLTARVVRTEGIGGGRFLDWAGGYGTLTRLLRDRGLDFHHYDPLCDNIFASGHEGDLTAAYDLVTAFEVLEHLDRPVVALAPVFDAAQRVLVSTYLLPDPAPAPDVWWYYARESGQHITFYTPRALHVLADRFGTTVTSDGQQLHLFHRGAARPGTRLLLSAGGRRIQQLRARAATASPLARRSLQSQDAEQALRQLVAARRAATVAQAD